MKFEFDIAKDASNSRKHGLSLADAAQLDWDALVAREDRRRSYSERRMIGMGCVDMRVHVVVFVERANAVRIISFRKANRREVKAYEATQTHPT